MALLLFLMASPFLPPSYSCYIGSLKNRLNKAMHSTRFLGKGNVPSAIPDTGTS